jgi:hypothetical protein
MKIVGKLYRFLYPRNKIKMENMPRGRFYEPSDIMFRAMFQVIVNYVEIDCARAELRSSTDYSRVDRFVQKWLPFLFSKDRRHQLGIRYLEWMESLGETSPLQSKSAKIIIDLYLWYRNEYPLLRDPYEVEPEPENLFVDDEGNPTKQVFRRSLNEDGTLSMLKFHDDYVAYLDRCSAIEDAQKKIINQKLKDILKVREYLYQI